MKGSSRRPEQVAETLRQVITDALAREVRDPRVGFVTVTGVLVTNDLSHARVMVSVPGEEADKARALEGLQSAAGFLRSGRPARSPPGTVPELHFELDRGLEHAARINELLEHDSAGGARTDRRGAGGQAGRAHLARRGAAGAARARGPGGGAHRHAGSVRHRAAGGAGGTGDPAGAVRRGAGQDLPGHRAARHADHTDDLTGSVMARFPNPESVPEVRLREELATFLGQHPQRPPAFSAKRVAGERSYRRARRGELVELAEVPVTVHDIELVDYRPPDLCFRAVVSPGITVV